MRWLRRSAPGGTGTWLSQDRGIRKQPITEREQSALTELSSLSLKARTTLRRDRNESRTCPTRPRPPGQHEASHKLLRPKGPGQHPALPSGPQNVRITGLAPAPGPGAAVDGLILHPFTGLWVGHARNPHATTSPLLGGRCRALTAALCGRPGTSPHTFEAVEVEGRH